MLLSQICFQHLAVGLLAQTSYGLLLYLSDAFAGKVVFASDFFQGHFTLVYPEVSLHHFLLPVFEYLKDSSYFFAQALLHQSPVGRRDVVIRYDIQQTALVVIVERCIYRHVT